MSITEIIASYNFLIQSIKIYKYIKIHWDLKGVFGYRFTAKHNRFLLLLDFEHSWKIWKCRLHYQKYPLHIYEWVETNRWLLFVILNDLCGIKLTCL